MQVLSYKINYYYLLLVENKGQNKLIIKTKFHNTYYIYIYMSYYEFIGRMQIIRLCRFYDLHVNCHILELIFAT